MHTFTNPSLFLSLRLCLSRFWILQLGQKMIGVVLQVQSGQAEMHINHQGLYVNKVQRLTEMRSGKVPRMEEMMLSQRLGLSFHTFLPQHACKGLGSCASSCPSRGQPHTQTPSLAILAVADLVTEQGLTESLHHREPLVKGLTTPPLLQ